MARRSKGSASPLARSGELCQPDPFLFHETIHRNLLWARPEASEGELWAAHEAARGRYARAASACRAGNGGRRAWNPGIGGRAPADRPCPRAAAPARLLLLDEATNAIDVAGEGVLLRRLRAGPERPTIIMIAHREQSLAHCERIIELREGRLARDVML
jgi:ATP-binding cassette subfamily C protein